MFDPISTYRIQFHKGFTFKDLNKIIPYLTKLGVKTIYASPIFEAIPGSMHGYDVTNPLKLNPEIGTLAELRVLSHKLKKLSIGWLQDIVPNHMAFHQYNEWLMDVLKNGKESTYSEFFDIEWQSDVNDGRIMVPFLGQPFSQAVAQKQIQVKLIHNKLYLVYFDQHYPLKVSKPKIYTPAYIRTVNANPQLIEDLIATQAYQLCFWQETDKQINYRRFFTVNGLICLNMQHESVFNKYHGLIKQLIDEGIFQGLRVDHIDGLYDPEGYLARLRNLTGAEVYITVEKILEAGEQFPTNWLVQGNTGYDFLGLVNNLFTLSTSKKVFSENYKRLTGKKENLNRSIHEKKSVILRDDMAGELENLFELFKKSDLIPDHQLNILDSELKEAIAQLLIYCPVYRYYGKAMPLNQTESNGLNNLIISIGNDHPHLHGALNSLRTALLELPKSGEIKYNQRALHFYQRLMQFTGPLMAKGVEDTLMYTYDRFIGHNEVGDSPASFGISPNEFHCVMIERQKLWPLSINGTSTHDTKRSEDVRARLNVLTDIPDKWFEIVQSWGLKSGIDTKDVYFIYQSILGAYPMPQSGEDDIIERMQNYIVKALREGKQRSYWAEPDEQYENKIVDWIAKLLNPTGMFMNKFRSFHEHVSDFGIINSLAQTLLKFTCPGIPDVYQGCELWDLSLVDPDNRRRVDYAKRQSFLKKKSEKDIPFWDDLWQNRYDGRIKLRLTQLLLSLRTNQPDIFRSGDYIPLKIDGKYKGNIFAFARQHGKQWLLTITPLHLATIGYSVNDSSEFDWADTSIILPTAAPSNWKNLLTGEHGYCPSKLQIKNVLKSAPVAIVELKKRGSRSAGLLAHITSLPSPFAIGDLGPEAYKFVDFLFESGQTYWQMLPVNPVDAQSGFSPYSSTSSMAGNPLLISPETLVRNGWLTEHDLKAAYQLPGIHADFKKVALLKEALFNTAYHQFLKTGQQFTVEFVNFKKKEAHWLDDFALYSVLKKNYGNNSWNKWPEEFKFRKHSVIKKFITENTPALDREKWLQYIFEQQWKSLKIYAKHKGITLLGDMPFYVSYDSADVWSYPHNFKLDRKGRPIGIAGVPPDYFSAEGQFWGMPVYDWNALKSHGYKWWIDRITKNLDYFDLIRLDHFRAFVSYWEIPGNEETAVNGEWVTGPGQDFFDILKRKLGQLPFVAEDLGEIDDTVYALRDKFNLPGMRVLQFAFSEGYPQSDHIPHNYMQNSFAYTGTHDNNTLKGWFKKDLCEQDTVALKDYLGHNINEQNVCDSLIRLCYASVAETAIVPLQDILQLDDSHRMNIPSQPEGNWTWRFTDNQLARELSLSLRKMTERYNR